MKYKIYLIAMAVLGVVAMTGCDKVEDLPYYEEGKAVTLSASSTNIAPPPADSNSVALTLSWTYPDHGTDTSNIKYVIEIDSAGKNFANAVRRTVMGSLSTQYIAKELNSILVARGYAFNVPVDMDVRLFSSYANNNDKLESNTIKIKMTPYKVPPKVALPASSRLFIVGDASTFGWSNDPAPPAFPAAREFARLDETTWSGVFYMNGSGGYKLLQTQGDWNSQFHMVTGGTALSGSFVQENADPTFPSPATAGWYVITMDFQQGKYNVIPFHYGTNPMPQALWMTGDAVPSSWTNTPPPAQELTRLNSAEFEITMALSGGVYKFLSTQGQWQPQFGGDGAASNTATSGVMGANYGSSSDPAAINTPAAAGTYKIRVNFATNRYSVTQ
jgi:starch-binding outer membrane protein SusE/F